VGDCGKADESFYGSDQEQGLVSGDCEDCRDGRRYGVKLCICGLSVGDLWDHLSMPPNMPDMQIIHLTPSSSFLL
jgi:hypothetical protein